VIAAVANLLLVLVVLIQGEPIMRALPWGIVPAIIVCYALAPPSAPRA